MTLDNQESEQIPEGAESPTSKLVSAEPQPYSEDGVSLLDLWIVLMKRRVLIGGILVITLLSGVIFFLFPMTQPQQRYAFSTTIESGRIPGQEGVLVNSTERVLAKLIESYIPLSRKEFAETKGLSAPDVQAYTRGALMVLKTGGFSQNKASHFELLESITQRLLTDHHSVIESYRAGVIAELERAGLRLEELKAQRNSAVRENELETQFSSQADATLEMVRVDLAIEQADQEQVISRIEERLRGFSETRVVLPPMQSSLAPSADATITLGATLSIAGFLGLALGIFAAFGAEFMAKARKEMSERGLLQS